MITSFCLSYSHELCSSFQAFRNPTEPENHGIPMAPVPQCLLPGSEGSPDTVVGEIFLFCNHAIRKFQCAQETTLAALFLRKSNFFPLNTHIQFSLVKLFSVLWNSINSGWTKIIMFQVAEGVHRWYQFPFLPLGMWESSYAGSGSTHSQDLVEALCSWHLKHFLDLW